MSYLYYVFAILTFFFGVFLGYAVCRNEGRIRNKIIWGRVERRNIMRTINALVSAIDFKDHLTRSHSDSVANYAVAIAAALGMNESQQKQLKEACHVHDLGKIGVHDSILTKPGKLTEKEFKEIKSHSLAGAVILKPFHFLKRIVRVVREHHERFDGTGYPDGLKGEDISLEARIMAVADSFDAMTSERPYRLAMDIDYAIGELERNKGTQFDPRIVDVFVKLLKENPDLFKRRSKENEPTTEG